MKLQIIFTFENKEQEIFNYKYFSKSILKSKTNFINWVKEQLTDTENESLVKLSCCLIGENLIIPNWYKKINGKIYF